jgi:hypothetical protein
VGGASRVNVQEARFESADQEIADFPLTIAN